MANKKMVIFQDHFKITKPSETVQNFNDFVSVFGGPGPKRHLRVQLEATHSAIRNKNNRFYIPSRMNEGSVTFLKGKPAPILKHHGSDEDPVGKVRSIEYVSTIPETLRDSKEVGILTDSTASISAQQKAARTFLQNDFISRDDWKGLGYINITADIMDPKAVQQIEDKLFDAVSVSFKSDHAVCSLCGKDWMAGDMCDHEPGKAYKDDNSGVEEKAVLIPGNMFYRECSLVNFDADPHSAVNIISATMNDAMEESCSDIITIQDTLGVASMQWEVRDSEEAVSMKTIQIEDGIAIELSDTEEKIFDIIKKHYPEDNDKQVAEAAKEIETLRDKENMFPDQAEANLDEETAVVYIYEAIKFGDNGLDSEAIYTGIIEELQSMAKEGLLTEDALKDAVLSTETRKKMGEKSFCGPERSFPVPDCCLSGETEIRLLNNKSIPIKELVGRENFWVYGFDTIRKTIVPAQVTKVWLAVKNAQLYKITLDNGKSIRVTGNHPFLLKSNEYKRADELVVGNSLMPLYTKLSKNRDGFSAYEQIYQPWNNYWEYTHHMVAREYLNRTLNSDEQVHHKNTNKRDNSPENLEQITREKHLREHFVPGARENKLWSEFSALCNEKLSHITPFTGSVIRSKRSIDWTKPEKELPGTGISLLDIRNLMNQGVPRKRIAEVIQVDDRTIIGWLKAAGLSSYATIKDIRKADLYKKALSNHFSKQLGVSFEEVCQVLKDGKDLSSTSNNFGIESNTIIEWARRLGEKLPVSAKSSTTVRNTMPRNHSIVSIELDGIEDAYDLEVPATSNFALTDGVFVHNSHVTAARRLIGRYKGPGDKTSILACVSRKAKAMGCAGGSKDAIVPPPVVENTMDKMSDDEVRGMFDKVETELLKRELVVKRECNTCMTSQERADKAEKELGEAKKSIEDKEVTLTLLRDELRNEFVNFKHIADELINQKLESRNLKAKYAGLVSVVSKQKDNLELATGEFKDSEDLDKAFDLCLENAKLEELLKKMHDGTANDPEGSVKDPTINNDKDNTQSEPGLSKQERAILSQIKTFIKNDNMSDARELYDRMKQYETLRESITWEGLLSESNGSSK